MKSGAEKIQVERTPREVIERKLLAALDDESKVAVLLTEQDIDHLLRAIAFYPRTHSRCSANLWELSKGLRQLQAEAFRS